MQIDRSITDDASSGERDGRFAFAAKERSENADGCSHFPDDFVRGRGFHGFGVHGHGPARTFHMRSEVGEDLEHVVDVAEIGHLMDHATRARQQSGCEDGQRGIF